MTTAPISITSMYQQIQPILDTLDSELLRLRREPLKIEHKSGVGSKVAVVLAEELGLVVVFSSVNQRNRLIQNVNQPVTVAIGQPQLAEQLVAAVEPWTK